MKELNVLSVNHPRGRNEDSLGMNWEWIDFFQVTDKGQVSVKSPQWEDACDIEQSLTPNINLFILNIDGRS